MRMVRPHWERLLHKNGKFAAEIDAQRGVIRFVDRGGTIEYDLATRMAEARQQTQGGAGIDTVANATG